MFFFFNDTTSSGSLGSSMFVWTPFSQSQDDEVWFYGGLCARQWLTDVCVCLCVFPAHGYNVTPGSH